MTEPLSATPDGTAAMQNLAQQRFERIEENKSVLALGPGLGLHPETQDFTCKVVLQTELPLVLDADGLNAFAGSADVLRDRKTKFIAITPHPGEMARLLMRSTKDVQEDRVKTAQDAARRWNAHVILKGSHTIITGPEGQVFINTSGNPGLAKGGSGDVLTGVLAALTAQFKTDDWARVLALGVYLHGKAAEFATKNTDQSGLLATEVAAAVPHARHQLLQELQTSGAAKA
jgi:NAD(P)H-hydrate epimerase